MSRRRVKYQRHVKQYVRTHADATVGKVTGAICASGTERKAKLQAKWAVAAGVKNS